MKTEAMFSFREYSQASRAFSMAYQRGVLLLVGRLQQQTAKSKKEVAA